MQVQVNEVHQRAVRRLHAFARHRCSITLVATFQNRRRAYDFHYSHRYVALPGTCNLTRSWVIREGRSPWRPSPVGEVLQRADAHAAADRDARVGEFLDDFGSERIEA